MIWTLNTAVVALAACTLAASGAEPAPSAPPALRDEPSSSSETAVQRPIPGWDYTVQIKPRVWYVAPEGDLRLPGGTGQTPLGNLGVDDPKPAPAGEVGFFANRWVFNIGALNTSQEATISAPVNLSVGPVSASAGQTVRTRAEFTAVDAAGGYSWDWGFTQRGVESADYRFRLSLLGGGRVYVDNFRVERPGISRVEKESTFFELFAQARGELRLSPMFSVEVDVGAGGWTNTAGFDVAAAFGCRPLHWLNLQIGYRLLKMRHSSDENANQFRFDGSLAGLFGQMELRF